MLLVVGYGAGKWQMVLSVRCLPLTVALCRIPQGSERRTISLSPTVENSPGAHTFFDFVEALFRVAAVIAIPTTEIAALMQSHQPRRTSGDSRKPKTWDRDVAEAVAQVENIELQPERKTPAPPKKAKAKSPRSPRPKRATKPSQQSKKSSRSKSPRAKGAASKASKSGKSPQARSYKVSAAGPKPSGNGGPHSKQTVGKRVQNRRRSSTTAAQQVAANADSPQDSDSAKPVGPGLAGVLQAALTQSLSFRSPTSTEKLTELCSKPVPIDDVTIYRSLPSALEADQKQRSVLQSLGSFSAGSSVGQGDEQDKGLQEDTIAWKFRWIVHTIRKTLKIDG